MESFKDYFEEAYERRNGKPYASYTVPGDDDKRYSDVNRYKTSRENAISGFKPDNYSQSLTQNTYNKTNQLLGDVMKYHGFKVGQNIGGGELNKLPSDGSLVYRGHKHPNPFSKSDDGKADGQKAYFGWNADYVYGVYAKGLNLNSPQIGQSGFNTLQSMTQSPQHAIPFKVGFFTVATPKDPNNILWYPNFGYEDNRSIDISEILKYKDAECVEPSTSFSKIRTYLVYQNMMISFERLKKIVPKLYGVIINSSVMTTNQPRVY